MGTKNLIISMIKQKMQVKLFFNKIRSVNENVIKKTLIFAIKLEIIAYQVNDTLYKNV